MKELFPRTLRAPRQWKNNGISAVWNNDAKVRLFLILVAAALSTYSVINENAIEQLSWLFNRNYKIYPICAIWRLMRGSKKCLEFYFAFSMLYSINYIVWSGEKIKLYGKKRLYCHEQRLRVLGETQANQTEREMRDYEIR